MGIENLKFGKYASELKHRQSDFGVIVYSDKVGDLMQFNKEKNTTKWMPALAQMCDEDFKQYEADCILYIENVLA